MTTCNISTFIGPTSKCTRWINVKSSEVRRINMYTRLDKHLPCHERFDAVTPESLPPGMVICNKPLKNYSREQQCVVACGMSHLDLLSENLQQDGKYSIVMEDDMLVDFSVDFDAIVSSAPHDWEILQLSCINGRTVRTLYNNYKKNGQVWFPWSQTNWGTGLFLVNSKIHEEILRSRTSSTFDSESNPVPVDMFLYKKFKTYTLSVPLFNFDLEISTIHPSHMGLQSMAVKEITSIFLDKDYPFKRNKRKELDMVKFLHDLGDEEIVFVPNPGNAGDALIAHGTFKILEELGVNYTVGNHRSKYKNKTLFYAGGGNFVGLYTDCRGFLRNNHEHNKIVLLPCTINNESSTLKLLGDNVTIICREERSYNYTIKEVKYPENVFLSQDMAFYAKDTADEYRNIECKNIGSFFRTDSEKTSLTGSSSNEDISNTLNRPNSTRDSKVAEAVSRSIFEKMSKYSTIETNRLHVSIAGVLIGRTVTAYPNSYWKNRAVYDYSLKGRPGICFVDKK